MGCYITGICLTLPSPLLSMLAQGGGDNFKWGIFFNPSCSVSESQSLASRIKDMTLLAILKTF